MVIEETVPDVKPVTTYCVPDDVAETMDLPDPKNPYGYIKFSNVSHPTLNQVNRMILSNEDRIDRRLRRTWRENRIKNQVLTIQTYQHDANAWRSMYFLQGGYFVQLRKDVREWDPSKGDKLELRTLSNEWRDVTDLVHDISLGQNPTHGMYGFWFDYQYGKLYISTNMVQPKANSVRISYRYGADPGEMPEAIRRLCCLETAKQIMTMQYFNIKVGSGGDISGIKDEVINAWTAECNEIYSSFQRIGSVHSMLR